MIKKRVQARLFEKSTQGEALGGGLKKQTATWNHASANR
jgi:hypothetical protein